jgi:oligopeptidase B
MKQSVLSLIFIMTVGMTTAQTLLKAPVCVKKPQTFELHGDKRVDNYYWLNQRGNAEVLKYLEQENAYMQQAMKHTEPLQETLYNEMTGRIKQDDASLPVLENGYWYYTRYEKGKDYAIYCRRKGSMDAAEEVILNENELAEGHVYYSIGWYDVSTDNTLMVYGADTAGRYRYTLRFKNLNTGEWYKDEIEATAGGAIWAGDNKTVFYTRKDSVTLRADKIYRHVLGTNPANDELVFHEKDEKFTVSVYKTKSGKFLLINSNSTLSSEFRYLSADNPSGEFKILHPREQNLLYQLGHVGDKFYITTNWNAKNFRLMEAPVSNPSKENWKEIVPHRPDVLLSRVEVFNNHLILSERSKGLTQLQVMNIATRKTSYIAFKDPVYVAGLEYNPEMNAARIRYNYASLTTPSTIYEYDLNTGQQEIKKQDEVLGGFKSENYVSERLWATAKDGTPVPISVVYRRGFKKDGKAPLLLYGYGSYGYSADPSFNYSVISLLDRGFAYAIAHIRGGQEMGREWYENGKMFKKKNTFTDFIDCAEHLIKKKFTAKGHIYARGRSAGGLLMGAITNMRPDLWKGVIAGVPFVDVINTMLDESIPLTVGEFDEWGNPKNKDAYFYMKSYSPYDNVEKKKYPHIFVIASYNDSQVQYFEPAKWVAKMREMRLPGNNNKLLFYCDMEGSHGGSSGRLSRLKQVAMEYAFMLDLEGKRQ